MRNRATRLTSVARGVRLLVLPVVPVVVNKTMFFNLTSPTNATIAVAQGVGTVLFPVGYVAPVEPPPPGGTGNITVSLAPARTTGVAPLSVFMDASATTATTLTSLPFHELVYIWSFGDAAGGATWAMGARAGQSKNAAYGPVSSHVFETAGTYTVTLSVYHYSSLGVLSTGSATQTITVTAADTVFAANTVCFSTSGTFTGAPAGATLVTTSDYASAISSYKGTKKRLLFRGGETFTTASGRANLDVDGPGILGSFGSGVAKMNVSGASGAIAVSGGNTPTISDWRIMDIEMVGANVEDSGGISAEGGFNKLLLLRLNIHDVTMGLSFSSLTLDYLNGNGQGGHSIWTDLSVVECRVNNIDNGFPLGVNGNAGGYSGYMSGARFTFMGNDFDNMGGGQHVIRTTYIGMGVFSNNTLARSSASKHCFKLHAPAQSETGTTGGGRYSEKVIISDNTMVGGLTQEVFVIGPQNTSVDERMRNMIVERNYFLAGAGVVTTVRAYGSTSLITYRNNIINASLGATGWGNVLGFSLNGTATAGGGPLMSDMNVHNNTIYKTAGPDSLSPINLSGSPLNTKVMNNLAYSTQGGSTMVSGTGGTGYGESNNTTTMTTNPLFVSVPLNTARQLSATDFKIGSTSPAKSAGIYTSASMYDGLNVAKTTRFDMGATQS